MLDCPSLAHFDFGDESVVGSEDLEPVLDPMELEHLHINEELVNPYGDEDEESSENSLIIILNSPDVRSFSPSSIPPFDFLEDDPYKITLDRAKKLETQTEIPQDELDRYKNGKRPRTMVECSSTVAPLFGLSNLSFSTPEPLLDLTLGQPSGTLESSGSTPYPIQVPLRATFEMENTNASFSPSSNPKNFRTTNNRHHLDEKESATGSVEIAPPSQELASFGEIGQVAAKVPDASHAM